MKICPIFPCNYYTNTPVTELNVGKPCVFRNPRRQVPRIWRFKGFCNPGSLLLGATFPLEKAYLYLL